MAQHSAISAFIDDQLDIGDKIAFVKQVHHNRDYTAETLTLLRQEKTIRSEPVESFPEVALQHVPVEKRKRTAKGRLFMGWLAPAFAVIIAFIWLALPDDNLHTTPNRFVVYRPDVAQIEIVGTFTHWKPTAMNKIGATGYWELNLDLPHGEHRFAYLLDGKKQWADPTVAAQEQDDFGGRNSIIYVGGRT